MPILELTEAQVMDLFKQLSPQQRKAALLTLAGSSEEQRRERLLDGENRLREVCAKRGLDWDKMSDEERLNFVDDLVHEDRACSK